MKKKWVMPEWMEKYRSLFCDPRIEEWMNCDAKACNIQVNAPRALICLSVHAQVGLMTRLREGGSIA